MMLVALAIAMGLPPVNTWDMGGGRSWMNPPKLGSECIYSLSCSDKRRKKLWHDFLNETAKSMAVIETAPKGGDPVAMRVLGLMLIGGVGVVHDEGAAIGWFYEAAIRGDAPSMYVLGRAFQDGVGVAPDPKLSAFWLQRAAQHGFTVEQKP
jgi:TPR repeat protein